MKSGYKISMITILCCVFATCGYAQAVYNSAATADTTTKPAIDTSKKIVAHKVAVKPKVPKIKPISKELSFGARLNTNGWSGFVDYGKVKSDDAKHSDLFYNLRFVEFEVTEKKNPKEEKTNSENSTGSGGSSGTYIYGKINNFYAIKLGYGFRKMIAGKPDPGTVSIHWVNTGGISIGLLKPYYLNAYTSNGEQQVKYTDTTKNVFLSQSDIVGKAGFGKGFNEITITPGIHFKSALHFDFSANRKTALALETGFNVELYSKPVPIMANQSNSSVFFDAFIALQFGKRW